MSHGIRKEVHHLKGYSLTTPPHRIKLNQNESPYDLPQALKNKILERLGELSWNRYPTPFCDPLRKKIAEKEGWEEKGVVVTGGSNILIQAILLAISVNGKILTLTPSFSLYGLEGKLLGNKVVEVKLSPDDFSLPLPIFLKTLKKEKPSVVFLPNPNAPTGTLFLQEDLIAFLKVAKGQGAFVVIDEAYYSFSEFTLRPYLKNYPNLILVRTLSKAFSLGGIRLGYLLAAPQIASHVLKVILPFSVGVLSQAVGELVLEEDTYVQPLVQEIIRERESLYGELQKMKDVRVHPSKANFLLFQSKKYKAIFKNLLDAGILIRDVSSPNLPQALRVTIGTPEENRLFLETMMSM